MQFTRMHEWRSLAAALLLTAVLAGGAPAAAQEAPPPQSAPSPPDAMQLQADRPQQDGQKQDGVHPQQGAGPDPEPDTDLKNLSLEELMEIEVQTVVSASKYRQKVSDAPASVSIVTADDIRKFGYRTLADVIRSVRGFYATNDRNYQYLGIRGFGRPGDYNTRILLLVDGHRMNDAVYSSAAIGTDFVLDVDLIERVEVTRGPGSSIYGSNAFFGVVNVITRHAMDRGNAEVSGEAGSEQTYKGRLTYGTPTGRERQYLLSASRYSSDGARLYFPEYDPRNPLADPRAANNGYADNGDSDRARSVFARYSSGGLGLTAAYVQRTKGIPTASYGSDFNTTGNRTTDDRAYLDAHYDVTGRGGTEYTLRGYGDLYRYDGSYIYSGTENQDRAYGGWYGAEARATGRVRDTHRIVAGAEYEIRSRQDQWNADGDAAGTVYLDDRRRSQVWAAYIQDEITISPVFLLYAGIRYDHSSVFGGATNPRLAAVLKPIENGTLKLLYGTAFRAPTVYEMWYQAPPDMKNNPTLQPEKITTYELVYEHDFGQGLSGMVGRYSYGIKDLVVQSSDGLGNTSFQNLERAEATGTELEVKKAWLSGVVGRANYAYQKAVNPTTGAELTNAPRHIAKLNLVVPFADERIVLGLEEQYLSSRATEAGMQTDGYFLTNITLLGRNRERSIEASVSVYNLLGEKYADPVSLDLVPLDTVQQDGRTIRIKLTYAF